MLAPPGVLALPPRGNPGSATVNGHNITTQWCWESCSACHTVWHWQPARLGTFCAAHVHFFEICHEGMLCDGIFFPSLSKIIQKLFWDTILDKRKINFICIYIFSLLSTLTSELFWDTIVDCNSDLFSKNFRLAQNTRCHYQWVHSFTWQRQLINPNPFSPYGYDKLINLHDWLFYLITNS